MICNSSQSNQTTVFLSSLLNVKRYSTFLGNLTSGLNSASIGIQFIDNTNDIWCCDFMPIQVAHDQFVQFSLTKDYYLKKDRHKRTDPAPMCKTLGIEPFIPVHEGKPIYLDGGNVILNPGRTIAIITDKVFKDNDIPRDDLERILHKVLQVENIVFIPKEPYDTTGHSDGMVRFVDDRTVVANDYSKINVSLRFRDRFYGALSGSGLDVLLVPYNPSDELVNGYQSAVGCYINFLKIDDKVFLPTFGDQVNDETAIKRFGEIFGVNNVIPVPSREIALCGGVLNCLSWEINH